MSSYHLLQEVDMLSRSLRKHRRGSITRSNACPAESERLQEQRERAHHCLKTTKRWALLLGTIVGFFLETAGLGACYFVKKENLGMPSQQLVAIAFVWCFFGGMMAASVCLMMRNLVWIVFTSSAACKKNCHTTDQLMELFVRNVDFWFGVGFLVGTLPSWAFSCLLLGSEQRVTHSLWVAIWTVSVFIATAKSAPNSSDSLEDIFAHVTQPEVEAGPRNAPAVETAVPVLLAV